MQNEFLLNLAEFNDSTIAVTSEITLLRGHCRGHKHRSRHVIAMKKLRVILLATAVATALGVIWWMVASRPPPVVDPVYAGRHLSYWLSPSVFTGQNFAARELSFIHSSLDSNAMPYLVQALRTRDGKLRVA
jgi:hypothetical protein